MTPDRKLGLVALAVAIGTGLLAADGVVRGEVALAEATNALPGPMIDVLEIVMQLGTRPAILLVAAVAVVVSDTDWRRVVLGVVLAGGVAWAASTVAKDVVERPRPAAYSAEIVVRSGASGPGWPSTHTAVAAGSLAAAALLAGRRPAPAIVLAGAVGVARMAVGVHLPLDVVGGLALGVAAAVAAVEVVDRR